MGWRSCFPELPRGRCWPRGPEPGYPGCFPGHESRPTWRGQAPSNNALQQAGAREARTRAAAAAVATDMEGMFLYVTRSPAAER
jgi:hypothetical protein